MLLRQPLGLDAVELVGKHRVAHVRVQRLLDRRQRGQLHAVRVAERHERLRLLDDGELEPLEPLLVHTAAAKLHVRRRGRHDHLCRHALDAPRAQQLEALLGKRSDLVVNERARA